jgi:hypothetical protein
MTTTENAASPTWPEWLTPEYTDMHTVVVNDLVQALDHCYGNADAAGMDWTMDGLFSVAANNVLATLRRLRIAPFHDQLVRPVQRLSADEIGRQETTGLLDEMCDECDEPATSVVEYDNGDLYYCAAHSPAASSGTETTP